ncbi:hypothetical protein C8R47DRAFT_1075282 [Mycena vitilis]|nr:hypothetical protein C8R47DRAFT_1075282 [Mycena vitilis]
MPKQSAHNTEDAFAPLVLSSGTAMLKFPETSVTKWNETSPAQNNTETMLKDLSPEIISMILHHMDPNRKITFSRTCKQLMAAYRAHIFNVTKKLIASFDLDADAVLMAMLKTNSIIVGSLPVAVLTDASFKPNNIDFLVPASSEGTMKVILSSQFGYSEISSKMMDGAHDSLRVEHKFTRGAHVINLRATAGENATVALMLSHSTIAMNFISAWGIFCAYPQLTLVKKAMFNHFTEDEHEFKRWSSHQRMMTSFEKYVKRDIEFGVDSSTWYARLRHRCYASPLCPLSTRSMYDRSTLFVRFPIRGPGTAGPLANSIRYDERHTVIWSLGGCFCNEPILYHRAFSHSKKIYGRVRDNSPTNQKFTNRTVRSKSTTSTVHIQQTLNPMQSEILVKRRRKEPHKFDEQ